MCVICVSVVCESFSLSVQTSLLAATSCVLSLPTLVLVKPRQPNSKCAITNGRLGGRAGVLGKFPLSFYS